MNVVIRDGMFPDEVRAANAAWPAADWSGWISYDPSTQCKRASDLKEPLPPACGVLLSRMAALPVSDWFGMPLLPDLSLWGAGLHEMPSGPGLASHLDADTHQRLGVERVLSGCLYVHERWQWDWGGWLLHYGMSVEPAPGRLVIFDCRGERHSVARVKCPAGLTRRAVALFWYACEQGTGRRLRADFTPE